MLDARLCSQATTRAPSAIARQGVRAQFLYMYIVTVTVTVSVSVSVQRSASPPPPHISGWRVK